MSEMLIALFRYVIGSRLEASGVTSGRGFPEVFFYRRLTSASRPSPRVTCDVSCLVATQ